MIEDPYEYESVSLEHIRNSNETRVVELLGGVLKEFPDFKPDELDIEDIYALTLNRLPARYIQRGSIQISGKLSDEEITWEINNAVRRVAENPTAHKRSGKK